MPIRKHLKGMNEDLPKRGLTVRVRQSRSDDVGVRAKENEKFFEQAIRQLKRLRQSEGLEKELRRDYYESKGTKRRREQAEARRRYQKRRRLEALEN